MLILTRRVGQSVCIGENVIVTVVEIIGNRVRIGIDAPKSLTVNRREVSERIESRRPVEEAGAATDADLDADTGM